MFRSRICEGGVTSPLDETEAVDSIDVSCMDGGTGRQLGFGARLGRGGIFVFIGQNTLLTQRDP